MITNNYEETISLGRKIGLRLEKGMVIALKGVLAGGKTTFTKGIGQALNVKGVVNSPTFTILKVYTGDLPLYHIDAYRLENNDYDLGLDELDDGVMVIEWPEYYSMLPKEYLLIEFEYVDDDHRKISFTAIGDKYKKVIEDL